VKFCPDCGAPTNRRVPEDDDRERDICSRCETIHYHNPKVIVGCIPEHNGQILMCKRAIEPRYGLWTLPAGFMENAETLQQGALRETFEETGSHAKVIQPYTLFSLPHINQVHMFFLADLLDENFGPTSESQLVELHGEDEILWDELAFPTVEKTLRHYFSDKQKGEYIFREENITLW